MNVSEEEVPHAVCCVTKRRYRHPLTALLLLLLLLLRARLQGTKSSKKKKQAKLKRVMQTLKKHARKEAALGSEGFAALHLLHDPQVTCVLNSTYIWQLSFEKYHLCWVLWPSRQRCTCYTTHRSQQLYVWRLTVDNG
jgi:hypothetical protein